MLRTIDGKSLLIGGLLVAVAVCAMAMTGAPWMNGEHNGRFAMIINNGTQSGRGAVIINGPDGAVMYPSSSDVYILDTATGQVWTPDFPDIRTFYAPKLEGYAPMDDPTVGVDPNVPLP
jgi:hypothetical protein